MPRAPPPTTRCLVGARGGHPDVRPGGEPAGAAEPLGRLADSRHPHGVVQGPRRDRGGHRIIFGAKLEALEQTETQVTGHYRYAINGMRKVLADRVIITLPFPLLRHVEGIEKFSNGKQNAIQGLNYNESGKILLQCRAASGRPTTRSAGAGPRPTCRSAASGIPTQRPRYSFGMPGLHSGRQSDWMVGKGANRCGPLSSRPCPGPVREGDRRGRHEERILDRDVQPSARRYFPLRPVAILRRRHVDRRPGRGRDHPERDPPGDGRGSRLLDSASRVSRSILFRLANCAFPAPGAYLFTVTVDGDWVAHRRLRIGEMEVSS